MLAGVPAAGTGPQGRVPGNGCLSSGPGAPDEDTAPGRAGAPGACRSSKSSSRAGQVSVCPRRPEDRARTSGSGSAHPGREVGDQTWEEQILAGPARTWQAGAHWGSLVTDGVGAAQRGPCVPVQLPILTVLPDARHASFLAPRACTQWAPPAVSPPRPRCLPCPPPPWLCSQFRACMTQAHVPLAPASPLGAPVSLRSCTCSPGLLWEPHPQGSRPAPFPSHLTPARFRLSFPRVAEPGGGVPRVPGYVPLAPAFLSGCRRASCGPSDACVVPQGLP